MDMITCSMGVTCLNHVVCLTLALDTFSINAIFVQAGTLIGIAWGTNLIWQSLARVICHKRAIVNQVALNIRPTYHPCYPGQPHIRATMHTGWNPDVIIFVSKETVLYSYLLHLPQYQLKPFALRDAVVWMRPFRTTNPYYQVCWN